jgi:hypothetical protein
MWMQVCVPGVSMPADTGFVPGFLVHIEIWYLVLFMRCQCVQLAVQ